MKQLGTLILAGGLLCMLVVVVGCDGLAPGKAPERPAAAPPPAPSLTPVRVALPIRGEIAAFFETTSRIEAENRVEVLSKGAGQCVAVSVDVGDRVESGQILAALERDELEAQVRQARISVQQQKTAYEIAERSFNEGIAASVDRDNTRFAYDQARVSLEMAELQLRNQTINAPIGGVITKRLLQTGMVVSPGLPAFSIVDADSYVLPIHVPEKELARLHEGQEAQARIDAFPDRVFTARVRRVSPSIDPASGTVRVLLDFEAADKPLLREAAFARVRLVMESRTNVLLVPREAILEEAGRKYVFVIESAGSDDNGNAAQIARRREIVVGIEQSDSVEALDGIAENEYVVIMGQHSLKPDTPVKISNLEEELAKRAAMTTEEALEAASTRQTTISGDRTRHSTDAFSF